MQIPQKYKSLLSTRSYFFRKQRLKKIATIKLEQLRKIKAFKSYWLSGGLKKRPIK